MNVRRVALPFAAVCGLVTAIVGGRMVLQPGPTDFAGGPRSSLADYAGPSPAGVPGELAAANVVERGKYLTAVADCAACHTAKGGVPFSGGRPFKLPFGTIYTPNITPDHETGIGGWSDADFLRAVHEGVGRDGERLYPAFPYASYAMLGDADVLAIKAYLFSLTPVRNPTRPNTFLFPFNQRRLMAVWSALFNRSGEFRPSLNQSPEWNRGAYLVEAGGHCGECHTPRNLMQAMDQRRKFAGGAAEGWNAYDISGDPVTGVGAWSREEIATYLRTGFSPGRGTASGPMAEVVTLSTSRLTPADVDAMATYLKTVPGIRNDADPGVRPDFAPTSPLIGGGDVAGRRIFEGACSSCHAWSGSGSLLPQAQLTDSRSVNDPSGINVARMILSGTGRRAEGGPYMPGFGGEYDDREIAAAANYVTARFGAKPSHLTPSDVARLRSRD